MARPRKVGHEIKAKASGVLYVEFYEDDGSRRRVSLETRDVALAKAKVRDIIGKASAPKVEDKAPMTMAELFDYCRTREWSVRTVRAQDSVKSNIKICSQYIGKEPITAMTTQRMELLAETMFAEAGYETGTVDRKLDTIGVALKRAVKEGWLDKLPEMPSLGAKAKRQRFITHDEEAAIFAAITARACAEPERDWLRFEKLIRFLIGTGARLGETLRLTALRVEHRTILDKRSEGGSRKQWYVNFTSDMTKSGKPRSLPLVPAITQDGWDSLIWEAKGGKLFPFKPSKAWYMWTNIRDDVTAQGHFNLCGWADDDPERARLKARGEPLPAESEPVVLHSLRHTCLTRMCRAGVRIERVSRWAGHASIAVTAETYAHECVEDNLESLELMVG